MISETHQDETKVKLQFKLRHTDKPTVFIIFYPSMFHVDDAGNEADTVGQMEWAETSRQQRLRLFGPWFDAVAESVDREVLKVPAQH